MAGGCWEASKTKPRSLLPLKVIDAAAKPLICMSLSGEIIRPRRAAVPIRRDPLLRGSAEAFDGRVITQSGSSAPAAESDDHVLGYSSASAFLIPATSSSDLHFSPVTGCASILQEAVLARWKNFPRGGEHHRHFSPPCGFNIKV